ncbi:MAG TPA: TolC family protein [Verrucomicrobiae bacterium]|nr:TolC family protein [Verrucomicrobiae bacterium]
MKRISAIVLFAAAIASASAQTNVVPVAVPTVTFSTNATVPVPSVSLATNQVPLAVTTNVPPSMIATNAVRVMSLQACFAEALKHNLDIQIQVYTPKLSLYDLYSAYGGYDPTLNLSGSHAFNVTPGGGFNQFSTNPIPARTTKTDTFSSDIGGVLPSGLIYDFSGTISDTTSSESPESTSGNIEAKLTQPLLRNFWTDNNRLAISVAKNRLKYSEQTLRQQLITTVTAVENAYYELIYARENVTVEKEALELAEKQYGDDQQRVQVGSLAPLDVQQDEAQVAQSRANLIAAQFTLANDQNTLKSLLTDNYSQWHDVNIMPAAPMEAVQQFLDVQDSWSKGLVQRPDMIQAKLDVEQQGFNLKYSFNQLFPELDLTGSYGFYGQGKEYSDAIGQVNQGNAPYYTVGAQFSVPLSNLKARSSYKSNKATEQQVLLKLKQLEQTVMVDIDNAVKQTASYWESVEATHEARVYAEAALDAEQKKYAVGKSTTFTVLQLQNNLTSARSQEIRAVANYNEELATLAQQEGNTLERRQIDFKVQP